MPNLQRIIKDLGKTNTNEISGLANNGEDTIYRRAPPKDLGDHLRTGP